MSRVSDGDGHLDHYQRGSIRAPTTSSTATRYSWAPSTTSGGENTTGGTNYIDDLTAAWNNAGAAIELQWDYDNGACGGDEWCAEPGGTWQTVTDEFFADP
jgi:hypothetical protein